jgi:hypothetical protein
MSETRVIHYDPDAPESTAARVVVRAPLLVLAHGWDRGAVDEGDMELFNLELNEVMHQIQDDPELGVRYVMELLMALDRAIEPLARRSGWSNEAVAYHLLRG